MSGCLLRRMLTPMVTQRTLLNRRLPERDIIRKPRKTARHAQFNSTRLRPDTCPEGSRWEKFNHVVRSNAQNKTNPTTPVSTRAVR
jgi:hypothetical protein